MKLPANSVLCYCFNVFDEKSGCPLSRQFIDKISAIRSKMDASLANPFELGLWLNEKKTRALSRQSSMADFKQVLAENNIEIPTINAFPYSVFHGERVKENVYLPDWRSEERLEYTIAVADILAQVLPENRIGSISTLPGGYKKFIPSNEFAKIAINLLRMNEHLNKLYKNTGKKIILAIEPEPDCIWESVIAFIEFKKKYLSALDELGNNIGICYDCSHAEVVGADPADDIKLLRLANIQIPKVQISAALSAKMPEAKTALAKFADDIYLHQTSITRSGKIVERFLDLSQMLEKDDIHGEALVHFHLPIFFDKTSDSLIKSARNILLYFAKIASRGDMPETVFEIETYMYSVLPHEIAPVSVETMIAEEYEFFILNQKQKTT